MNRCSLAMRRTRRPMLRGKKHATVAAALAVALATGSAYAQAVVTWTNTGAGTAWISTTNWSTAAGPGAADIALFPGNNPTSSLFVNMGSALTNNGSRNQAVGAIEIAAGRTAALTLGNSSTTTTGTFTLNGATVNGQGNVILRNASDTGLLTITNTIGSNTTFLMPVVLGNATNNVILVDGSAGITMSSEIQGSGRTLTLAGTGSGILTLSASNSYSGTTTLSAGTLQVGNASALGAASNALAVNGGALNLAGNAVTVGLLSGSSGGQITSSSGTGTLTANSTANGTFAGTVTGAINFVKNGSGTLTLTGSNSYTGTTTIAAGQLSLSGGDNRLATNAPITITGGVLDLGNASQSTSGAISFRGGTVQSGTLTSTGVAFDGQAGTVSAILAGSGIGLTKTTSGTLTLAGVNSYSGTTVINAGVLVMDSTAALGTGTVTFGGGTLRYTSSSTADDIAARIAGSNAAIAVDTNAQNVTWAGAVASSNVGGLTKLGSGTLALSGSNAYAGGTTLSAGAVAVGNAAALGTGTVSFANTAVLQATVSATVANPFAVSAGVTGTFDTQGNTFVLSRANGQITGTTTANLVKIGSGTLALAGTSSYTGTITVNAGMLWVQGNATGANGDIAASSIVVNDGGTFRLGTSGSGNPELPNTTYLTLNAGGRALWQAGETFGGVNLLGGTLDLQNGNINGSGTTAQSWTSGTLTNTGVSGTYQFQVNRSIDKTTSGTVSISGPVSLTASSGTVRILAGTIFHAAAVNLGTVPVLLGSGSTAGTFAYGGASASRSGGFALSGLGGTIRVDDAAAILGLDSLVSGTGGLTKAGSGGLQLSAGGAYTGATTVAAGSFIVNGNLASSAVTVDAAGTLMGSGTIAGATTIAGIHAPGNSPGLQAFSGGLQYTSSGTLVWDLWSNTILGRGTNYDGIDVTGGALTIDPAATLRLDFGTTALGSTVSWTDGFWDLGRQWTVIDVSGTATWDGANFGTLVVGVDASGASLASVRPGASFSVTQSGGDLVLVYAAVPEPGSLVLAGIGIVAAAWAAARRHRR